MFQKVWGIETFSIMRVMSSFYIELFVSQCRKTSQWNPSVLCFRKIPVANVFSVERGLEEVSNFLSSFFCLTVPKRFLGEPFGVSLISCIEKFFA